MSRKQLLRRLAAVWLGMICACAVSMGIWQSGQEKKLIRELPAGYLYTEGIREILKEQKDAGNPIALWRAEKKVLLTNPEFNRSISFDAIGLAGDSAVLFPGENALGAGEEGDCLLGADVARRLFGSTKISGRTVWIGNTSYLVAGILYEKKNICVYELSPKEREELDYAGISYKNKSERNRKERCLQTYLGIEPD